MFSLDPTEILKFTREKRVFPWEKCPAPEGMRGGGFLDQRSPSICGIHARAILTALREASGTAPVTEPVGQLPAMLGETEPSAGTLMRALALVHRPTFLYPCLQPASAAGLIAH
jgi:hypothetical protein